MDSALYYWLSSVSAGKGEDELVVAPLDRPDATFLAKFERIYLFTLAEILNHGALTLEEHARIFRVEMSRSRVVFNYLLQLNLIKPLPGGEGETAPHAVNPVFWHLVASSLEAMRILY